MAGLVSDSAPSGFFAAQRKRESACEPGCFTPLCRLCGFTCGTAGKSGALRPAKTKIRTRMASKGNRTGTGQLHRNVPLALLLLVVLELSGTQHSVLHGLGIALLSARLLHAWGMSRNEGANYPRLIGAQGTFLLISICLLYTSPSPRDQRGSRMPSSA